MEILMGLKKYLFLFAMCFFNIYYANNNYSIVENDKVIARIGKDYNITFENLSKYVADWSYNIRYRNKAEAYKKALDAMIINQLKRFDFFERGLNKNQDLMKRIRRSISDELINAKKMLLKHIKRWIRKLSTRK
jgi:hypothetical protein